MLCRVFSATCLGLEVVPITIEVSVQQGVGIYLVGLPDSAVRESLLRVTTALKSYGFNIPGKKTVINLAPANIKKEGSAFDAAIAVGLLLSSGYVSSQNIGDFLLMGELSLDGKMRPVPGALPVAMKVEEMGYRACIFPSDSAGEAAEVEGVEVYGAKDIVEVIDILNGEGYVDSLKVSREDMPAAMKIYNDDFKDVMGQEFAKRGLEIAASGGHNILLTGPPGAGKSFMSRCLASILPPMEKKESLETSAIYSVAGLTAGQRGLISERPFRSVHHSCSAVSLIGGGGQTAIPGEVSLSHNGVLFLDEISLFPPSILDMLRQPMEDRYICISRAKYKVRYPASFMLVASMNPCPCGFYGEEGGKCTCTPGMISRYMSKISGPLLDRIDLNIRVHPVDSKVLVGGKRAEKSEDIARRVKEVREIQAARFKNEQCFTNSQMSSRQLALYCPLKEGEKAFLDNVIKKYSISARGYDRIMKISRTLADMDRSERIMIKHLSEAVHYRFFTTFVG